MSRHGKFACILLLVFCAAVLSGCRYGGAASPREAVLYWSSAVLNRDEAALDKYWLSPDANVDATRKDLGVPSDPAGVEVVVLSEVDHVLDARIDIVFRRGGQDLTPRIPLAASKAENAWYVAGVVQAASPEQKRAIDGVATEFLTSLATGLSAHPVSPNGSEIDITAHRASALGPFAKATLSNFKVRSITDETVDSTESWFAESSVTAIQGGRPVAFSVQLTGPAGPDNLPVSVTDGQFVWTWH